MSRRLSRLDRERLVRRLPPVEYHRPPDEQRLFDEASLPSSLPLMLGLDQEAEYLLCRAVAERALGYVPEPIPTSSPDDLQQATTRREG